MQQRQRAAQRLDGRGRGRLGQGLGTSVGEQGDGGEAIGGVAGDERVPGSSTERRLGVDLEHLAVESTARGIDEFGLHDVGDDRVFDGPSRAGLDQPRTDRIWMVGLDRQADAAQPLE